MQPARSQSTLSSRCLCTSFISTAWRRYQHVSHLELAASNRREGRKNKGSLKNSYKLEQGNDQNVNGDTAMNTDRVQPQFKRSHLSVNIQPVSGITTREVGRSGGNRAKNCRTYSQHRSDSTAHALTETSESEMAT